ncbi:DUF742 domain-containing protein [Micromonospora sp. WMMA1923]|uniref:DUF742 domain-containing protein n=1 Tax=Micromonospora sp. WMMA1923 TaxID=3404125 RepID=UPI003B9573E9
MTPDVPDEEPEPEPSIRIRPYLQAPPPATDGAPPYGARPVRPAEGNRPYPAAEGNRPYPAGDDPGLFPADEGPAPFPVVGDSTPDAPDPVLGHRSELRPFVLTAGRVTGADPEIGLETQVTTRVADGAWGVDPIARLTPELQAIIAVCVEPTSVAEISARTRLHLGVTRVLVGDLRAAGHLDVHVSDVPDVHDPDLILRVIDGLRAIS